MTEARYRRIVATISPATVTKQHPIPLEANQQRLRLEEFGSLFSDSAGARFSERFDYIGADSSFEIVDGEALTVRYTILVPAPLTEKEWLDTMIEALGHAHAMSDKKHWQFFES